MKLVTYVVTVKMDESDVIATRNAMAQAISTRGGEIQPNEWAPDADTIADAYGVDAVHVEIIGA